MSLIFLVKILLGELCSSGKSARSGLAEEKNRNAAGKRTAHKSGADPVKAARRHAADISMSDFNIIVLDLYIIEFNRRFIKVPNPRKKISSD
jgi:hypothetical protein